MRTNERILGIFRNGINYYIVTNKRLIHWDRASTPERIESIDYSKNNDIVIQGGVDDRDRPIIEGMLRGSKKRTHTIASGEHDYQFGDPVQILKLRLAKGEITKSEYFELAGLIDSDLGSNVKPCATCGAENKRESLFCINCGSNLSTE